MQRPVTSAEDRLSRLLELQSLLHNVSRDIGPGLELQPVLHRVLEAMRSLVDFRGGSICLLDDEGNVYMAAADPPASPEVLAARVPAGTGLSGQVVKTGLSVYCPDLDTDPRVDPALRNLGSNRGMHSYLAVPLICLSRVIGLLQVDSVEVDAFDDYDVQVLEGLGNQVAGAIESARRHEEIVRLDRLKSDFIARVSHELRTPLTIVGGFTETLLALGPQLDDARRDGILRRMQLAMHRLQSLVDEVLTVAGYEAGVIAPHPTEVSLADLCRQVRDDCADPGGVEVQVPDAVRLVVDPKLLRHALRLLVDNALKYAGRARIQGGIDADTGAVLIDVVDKGPGIPVHLRDRVFERFTRGDDTSPGMGLGLPLVRMLAGGCNAKVEMHHPPEGGALFRLRFL